MVGRWVGDDDGDAGFGASVSFKECFVCSQSSVHRYEDVENFHIGGNCGNFFGNNLIRKFGYRPGIKYKSYFKDDPYVLQSLITIASNMKACLRFFALIS